MNFLGHCLFSDQTPTALAGSLWPDFGLRPTNGASESFLQHFDRHQLIDKFTDTCNELEPVRAQLRPIFRKTTPVVIDVLIDHYLASRWLQFHKIDLRTFSANCYQQLALFDELPLNPRFEKTLGWMSQYDWFGAYATTAGIERALKGIAERINFDNPLSIHAHEACSLVVDLDVCFECYLSSLSEYLETKHA